MAKFNKCENFDVALSRFMSKAQESINKCYAERYSTLRADVLVAHEKQRYVAIEAQKQNSPGASAWAFVEKTTGDIFKPASWRGPAMHARGSIFSDQDGMEALDGMGWHIRYLV